MTLNPDNDTLRVELSDGIAKYNNPCNTKFVDCYIADTQIRIKRPEIRRLFLEGPKYYDANDVLLEEVPDRDIPADEYEETLARLVNGKIYTFQEKAGSGENDRICEIAIDVEDDTWWLEIGYEKIIVEWDRFRNRVDSAE